MSVSVLILTLNEEVNLPSCLESVSWCDDIVVFDSCSTDRTVEIARNYGARVVQRRFDNERAHRTASLQVGFKYPWVYNPDADELTPPDLRDEIRQITSDPTLSPAAYRLRFKVMFMGRWLRHSTLYPTWVVRLFRPERLSFERRINLRYVVDGEEGTLKSHFLHYSFRKGMFDWFAKHNRYSKDEAFETIKALREERTDWRGIFGNDPSRRRAALKNLSFRMPCRPLFKFLFMYVIHLGFLDGRPGLTYCVLQAVYEAMIVAKVAEIRRTEAGLVT